MRHGRRAALLAVLATTALALLAGCGRAPGAAGGAAELRRGNGPEPDSLDPQLARGDSAATILRDVYEGLATLDHEGRPVPGAASRWEVSADGRSYTFHLRPTGHWSNGEPVTAGDFVASWRRLVAPATGAQYAEVLKPVAGAAEIIAGKAAPDTLAVRAADPSTLVVTLAAPTPYFPGLVAHWSTFPTYRGQPPAAPGAAVSNGAYRLSEWVVGAYVAAERNAAYWNDAATHVAAVRYLHIADANDEYTRYRAGALDATYTLPMQPFERLAKAHGTQVHRAAQLGVYYYGFNLTRPPFRDAPGLRQALSMTIDRERLVGSVTALGELPAYSWIPPGIAGYTPVRYAWVDESPADRLAHARRLYAAAGYSAAKPLRIELRFPSGSTHERIALAVASMWHESLGVETRLIGEEFKSLLQTINRGETEVFRSSWIADYNDPWTFAEVLQSDFGINLPRYRSAAYDASLARAAATLDPAERVAALQDAERRLLEDAPLVPLYCYVNKHLVAPRVRGWYDNVMNVTYTKDLELKP